MGTIRALLRTLVIVPTIAMFFLVWGLGLLFVLGSERALSRWRSFILRHQTRVVLFLAGARVESRGNPPRPPFILVSNHLSYVDILVLASHLDAVFVSKQEIASWPVIGLLCRAMGTVFINRESRHDITRVLEQMHHHLDLDCGVVFFPEGTSSDGSGVLRFRPSLLEIAIRLEHPVDYVTLVYETNDGAPPARDSVCWWGDAPFLPHLWHLLTLKSFTVRVTFGSEPIVSSDRKELAARLEAAVARQLSPDRADAGEREDPGVAGTSFVS